MSMVKKIALTASIMLFVLAQAFSFYLIFISHQEKIELLREKEGKYFTNTYQAFYNDLLKADSKFGESDSVVTYCFRQNMPEGSALYKGEKELYNSSSYEFDVQNLDLETYQYPYKTRLEKINGRWLMVFYMENDLASYSMDPYTEQKYYFFYVLDVTSVYTKSFYLVIRELLISFFASVTMALLLIYLIKKITKPLQAVNETQRQLIGSMSHELKTPLTAIKGYSETLLNVKLSEEQKEKSLRYIHRESGRLSRLSEKMMELTRLYEPECNITLQDVPVETLFETVENSVKHRLLEKGITLVFEGSYQGRKKKIDADLMTSFLINLMNNSIMASEHGSCIYMGADETSLWVRDEGCGIPKEEVDKVKKAFYRVDKSRSRKSGNMGLGLALCEQIARVHHGCMEIESEPFHGTKVAFTNHLQQGEYL